MRRLGILILLFSVGVTSAIVRARAPRASAVSGSLAQPAALEATVVATGIPGVGAIAQIGTFHKGGPFRDNPVFAPSTAPGQVLDRRRLFVASSSNFGAPLARAGEAAGSILSIDVTSGVVNVPAGFAAAGGQVSTPDGRVILYTAQSPAFVNGNNNPGAVTKDLPAVSLPLGISFNNGFGRPWFANTPTGSDGDGTITVIDPSGVPLAGAPSAVAGGVFAGSATNRVGTTGPGLSAGALATALITKSPDLTGRAVFLAALADGSVAQVHVQKGVDGLAPAGSFTAIAGITPARAASNHPAVITRTGMVFNWVPTRNVFITDPLANRVLVLDLTDDGVLFHASARYLNSPFFDRPVDIAAAVPEVAARNFASNTTLGGGSDLYVLNRGNNTILRMTQDGRVIDARRIDAAVPGFRANGLAVSEDARTIWVTAAVPDYGPGVVLEMSTFGAGPVTDSLIEHARNAGASGAIAQGTDIFTNQFGLTEAVGPLFNGRACAECHGVPSPGGMGTSAGSFVTRFGRFDGDEVRPIPGHAPIARQRSVTELGESCGIPTGVPPAAEATSLRSAMTLRGTSLIDNIQLSEILAGQAAQLPAVRGRLNVLADGRPGRFGWKAQTATLVEFMAEALRDEMGVTNPMAPDDLVSGCRASVDRPEADAVAMTSLVAFLNTIDPPSPSGTCLGSAGAAFFQSVGCATCHRPAVPGPGGQVRLYSDLLLHDMGPGLADGFVQGSAGGSDFRTAPLWRVSDRLHFLHDGRAHTILDAILQHGGQAAAAKAAFEALTATERQALLDYLGCI